MSTLNEFYEVLEQVMTRKESILVVASDYESEVLDTLILNKIKAGFKICVVKTPRLNRSELMEDIAAVTGATILNDTFEKALALHLGGAEKIVVDKHNTTIINGRGQHMPEYLEWLKQHGFEERYSKLQGGNALMYPLKQICSNAGIPGDVVVEKLVHSQRQDRINYGYNAKTNLYGDLIEMGVIDPAKAVRVALENAASVAGLFLTTECVIVDDID